MMEIDFRKYTLVRGIQLLSEFHPKFGVLSMTKEIVLEFIDQNGQPVLYNNGDLLIANTNCNQVEMIALQSPIRTNILSWARQYQGQQKLPTKTKLRNRYLIPEKGNTRKS